MNYQIFTASYFRDIEWYRHSLMSMKKFCVGFLPPVVCVSKDDYPHFRKLADQIYPEAEVKVYDGTGFMRAQISMMRCDELCPDADVIFLLGSDCLIVDEMRPEPYFYNGLPVMLYATYHELLRLSPAVAPWKKGTERVLGFKTPHETMRRLPNVFNRSLYAPMRAHVEAFHKMPFDKYIYWGEKNFRGTSEANILGGFAWEKMRGGYHWHCLDSAEVREREQIDHPNPVAQFWSWSGIDAKCDRSMNYPGGNTLGKTARQVFKEILG